MGWDAANSYCNNLSLHGVSGWKMSSRDELVQMYADRNSIGGFKTTVDYTTDCVAMYWSSTAYGGYYYYLNFATGALFYNPNAYNYGTSICRVRPIKEVN